MNSTSNKSEILEILYNMKHKIAEPRANGQIPVYRNKEQIGTLSVITTDALDDNGLISLLAKWRKMHEQWYFAQFQITDEGTKKWLDQGVLECEDRILFLLKDKDSRPIGHLGLFRFDFENNACEVDNILRGESSIPGIMTDSLNALMHWGISVFSIKKYTLQTYTENTKAISLYERLGFKPTKTTPLVKKEQGGRVDWIEAPDEEKPERNKLEMEYIIEPKLEEN